MRRPIAKFCQFADGFGLRSIFQSEWAIQKLLEKGADPLKFDRDIANLSDEEILSLRLCDLPVSLETPWFEAAKNQVLREMAKRGLKFTPHFWISTEWFCPDGVPGVAVPFFLLHPRLRRIEKSQMGFVDGVNQPQRIRVLRHEIGHAIDNAFRLRKVLGSKRKQVFGDSRTPYPRAYAPQIYSRSYVQNLGLSYAQSHPDEDFAETFAVWLTSKKKWQKKYTHTRALEKLRQMDLWMSELENVRPLLSNVRRVEPIESQTITLREYYRRKRSQFGIPAKQSRMRTLRASWLKHCAQQDVRWQKSKKSQLSFFEQLEKRVIQNVSHQLGQPAYRLKPLFGEFKKAAKIDAFTWPKTSEKILIDKMSQSFQKQARDYIAKKRFYVVM